MTSLAVVDHTRLSIVRCSVDVEPRCPACGRMLARRLTRPWVIDCPRCKKTVEAKKLLTE